MYNAITRDNDGKWTEVTTRKRPRASPGQQQRRRRQANLDDYWLSAPIPLSNGFANLVCDDQQESEKRPKEMITKPPPLFVDKVENIHPLIKLLKDTAQNDYKLKILRAEQIKTQPKSTLTYTRCGY